MTQRVLITAGAGGIGLAIARAFVAHGARVHIADVNAEAVQEITAHNAAITGSVGDVSRSADLDTLFRDVQEQLGGSTCSSTTPVSPARRHRSSITRLIPGARSSAST